MKFDTDYQEALQHIMLNGHDEQGDVRTGIAARKVFGLELKHDMREGFPATQLKPLFLRGVIREFMWMFGLNSTNIRYLVAHGCSFWTEWPLKNFNQYFARNGFTPLTGKEFEEGLLDGTIDDKWGDCGPVYGKQFGSQLADVIGGILDKPNSRRLIITNWNPEDTIKMLLPPCHGNHIQFNVEDNFVDCIVTCRSTDMILGYHFNLAFYGILLEIVAAVTNRVPRHLHMSLRNAHIYSNHFEAAEELIARTVGDSYETSFSGGAFNFLNCSREIKNNEGEVTGRCFVYHELQTLLRDFDNYKFTGYKSLPKLESPTPVAV